MYVPLYTLAGMQPADLFVPDTTQKHPLGSCLDAQDEFFGYGKFIYGMAAAAINNGRLSYLGHTFTATDIPNTANTGFPIVVNPVIMPINSFGWFQCEGMCAIQVAASVAVGVAIGVGAAGQGGTNSAGKQLLGVRVVQPSTYAPTQTIITKNGSPRVKVFTTAGLIQGLTVSGTGIPGATTITAIDPGRNEITLSANATATGQTTGTFTWTGFVLVQLARAFVQGAIT